MKMHLRGRRLWAVLIAGCVGLLAPITAVHAMLGLSLAAEIQPVGHSQFTGRGVRVGVFDRGFDTNPFGDVSEGLSTSLKEVINVQGNGAGTHGARVALSLAGRDTGRGDVNGMAYESDVYFANTVGYASERLYSNFHERGVSIINNSWSWATSYKDWVDKLSETKSSWAIQLIDYWHHRAILEDDQLLIWAAGNQGASNPQWPASAPSEYSDLERGWITVAWVKDDDALHPRSNACGTAANWCMSATPSHPKLKGTSFSAPIVTATAALVSEAFPWMGNHALRQTLLSTADPLGDRAIYGWGKVNPDKAVRGPGRFDTVLTFGDFFYATFDRYRSVFSNDIAGDAGLVKDGTGTLVLSGENTYTGPTHIHGGTLALHGSVAADIVNKHGIFATNGGRIGGGFLNKNVALVQGAGLRIDGNLITDGLLQVQLGSSVTVAGDAYIDGGRLEVTHFDSKFFKKKQAAVLHAANIYGEFSSVSGGGLLQTVQPIYTTNQIEVVVHRSSTTSVASQLFEGNRAKLAAANAVDVSLQWAERKFEMSEVPLHSAPYEFEDVEVPSQLASRELDVPENNVVKLADAALQGEQTDGSEALVEKMEAMHNVQSVAALACVLDSLTGEIHASSQALSFQQSQTINRALSNRVDTLSQVTKASGLWVSMLGSDGKLRERGYAPANTHLFAAQLGADHHLSDKSIVGAALSWSNSKADFHGVGGNSKGQSIGVSLYGRYGEQFGNYLAGRIGHDRIQSKVSRSIVIDQPERVVSNRQDGMTSLYAELGHAFDVDGAKYTPFAGAEYNHLKRGAFKETGSALALHAGSASYDEAAVSLGLHYQSAPISWMGGETILKGSGTYRYGNAPNLNFSAAFNGAPDASFTLQGIGLPKHSGWVGLGITTQPTSTRVNWFVNVDTQLERKGVTNNAISAGLRYDFG